MVYCEGSMFASVIVLPAIKRKLSVKFPRAERESFESNSRLEQPSPYQPGLQKHCLFGNVVALMSMHKPRLLQSAFVTHSSVGKICSNIKSIVLQKQ